MLIRDQFQEIDFTALIELSAQLTMCKKLY